MYYGTLLGVVWGLMYLSFFAFLSNRSMTMAFIYIALFFCSPFIAGKFATRYRDNSLEGIMTYGQAWRFIFYIYIFASLTSAVFNIVYFEFIENGTLFAALETYMNEMEKLPGIQETFIGQYRELLDSFKQDNVWMFLENDLTNSIILPTIIALFVRKTDRKPTE